MRVGLRAWDSVPWAGERRDGEMRDGEMRVGEVVGENGFGDC